MFLVSHIGIGAQPSNLIGLGVSKTNPPILSRSSFPSKCLIVMPYLYFYNPNSARVVTLVPT
jgi:hypothetical protein